MYSIAAVDQKVQTEDLFRPDENVFPFTQHKNYASLIALIKKWRSRFPFLGKDTIYNDVALLFTVASRAYLDQHSVQHLFRLVFSLNIGYSYLLHHLTLITFEKHSFLKLLPTHLVFPFHTKHVLGCLIGISKKNIQDVVDIECFQMLLSQAFSKYQIVSGSLYLHPTQSSSITFLYFEIEKDEPHLFSIEELKQIREVLQKKIEGDLPRLTRRIFMPRNQEEVYKNIFLLSQELKSPSDLPHLMISLDEHLDEELIFLINLVYVSPQKPIDLEKLFTLENPKIKFVSEHLSPVSFLDNRYPIIAHVFRLHMPLHPNLLRNDGALNFYYARKELAALLERVLGEFRDCNGGLILKFEEQLSSLKNHFLNSTQSNAELIEAFFYSLAPIEKQATLPFKLLRDLYSEFIAGMGFQSREPSDYYLHRTAKDHHILISVRLSISPFHNTIKAAFEELKFKFLFPITWSFLEVSGGLSLTILLDEPAFPEVEVFYSQLKAMLDRWSKQVAGHKVIRVALHRGATSLDPRLGSDESSSNLLRMLFEGLTRFDAKGKIVGGLAESFFVSPDKLLYRFKLRHSVWNNGKPLTAHDFVYSWKKILSPGFSFSFAYFLYPIQKARAIKEGRAKVDELGVKILDDYTLEVMLEHPTPYFLELLTHPLLFPVNQHIDKEFPQWPDEVGTSYPCNGPFQLILNHPNYGYQLVKNPYYWNSSEISLDQMIFVCLNSDEAQALFHQGKIDLIGDPFSPPQEAFFAQTKEEDRFVSSEQASLWSLLNTQVFPFNRVKFRLALSLSINRKALVTEIYPHAETAHSLLLTQHSQSSSPYTVYDPIQAKLLLHEFLEEENLKLKDLPCFKLHYSSRSISRKAVIYFKSFWEKNLGIRTEIIGESWNRLYQRFTASDFQIGLIRWASRFNDPIYNLNAFRYSSGVVNFSRWESTHYQKLLDQVDTAAATSSRQEYLKQAEQVLNQELPVIPLVYTAYQCVKREGVDSSFLKRCGFFDENSNQ